MRATLPLGLLGLLTACGPDLPEPATSPKHAVLIVLDTVRADVWEEVDTPVFDALGERGTVAKRAWSPGTWTAPGVVSLFTGAHVREHGWDLSFPHRLAKGTSYPGLPADMPVLAEVLADAGFKTNAAFANPLLGRRIDFSRGFDKWKFVKSGAQPKWVARQVKSWDDGERHFLYVHQFGCHSPLNPSLRARIENGLAFMPMDDPPKWGIRKLKAGKKKKIAEYGQAYRAKAEDLDRMVGEIIAALGPYAADTAIVVTSDHGELLGEHGVIGHRRYVWEPLTHVPLAALGTDPLPPMVTTAVVPDLITRALNVPHDWPISLDNPGPLVSQREGKIAFSSDGVTKGIWDAESLDQPTAYNVEVDPLETNGLPMPVDVAASRRDWAAGTPERHQAPVDEKMDAETMDVLEALGYVE